MDEHAAITGPRTVESRMVRYRYGPWDHLYYPTLGYLVGKGLIRVEIERGTETFRLTSEGLKAASTLSSLPEFAELVERAQLVYRLFNSYSGNRLKQFIYDNFPSVVGRKYGEEIS